MLSIARTVTAAVFAIVLAMPAIADDMAMKDGMMSMMGPDGKMTSMMTSGDGMKKMSEAMSKMGTEMKAPVIMMMTDGKMMMMNYSKMSDGKMMSDHMMDMMKK
jgi:hypothetical protein